MTSYFEDKQFDSAEDLDHPFGDDMEFEKCLFQNFNLQELTAKNTRFIDCHFIHCNFSNAIFTNSSFKDVQFENCKLLGINWTSCKSISHLHFSRCFLDYSSFREMDLRLCHWDECEMKTLDFSQSNLANTRIIHCNLQDTAFHQTNLEKADLTDSFNLHLDLRENKLKHAIISTSAALSILETMGIKVI